MCQLSDGKPNPKRKYSSLPHISAVIVRNDPYGGCLRLDGLFNHTQQRCGEPVHVHFVASCSGELSQGLLGVVLLADEARVDKILYADVEMLNQAALPMVVIIPNNVQVKIGLCVFFIRHPHLLEEAD